MMAVFQPDISPRQPSHRDFGIGIIGAGGIIQWGHMPAYRKAGFNVVGIASRTRESAERMAKSWDIPRVFDDWRALLDIPEVQIADVSYPFDEDRLEIVREAAARGKHILVQKPMAHSRAAAREMVETAARHGVRLAVNQNARWAPQYRAARLAIEAGLLGDVYLLIHEMQNNQDSKEWFAARYGAKEERFLIVEYSVHHLDLMRFWTGLEPTCVKASIARKPSQRARGEMIASIQLEFANRALGLVMDDNAAYPSAECFSRFKIEGTRGLVEGNAMGAVDFRIRSDSLGGGVHSVPLGGQWFPDGFIGTMGELMCAIEERREPSISGWDNLNTLELVFAAYRSLGA